MGWNNNGCQCNTGKLKIVMKHEFDWRDIKRSERNSLVKWANALSEKELNDEYYEAVYDSLGSQTDKMYELGYDMKDIKEREEYEKYLCEKADILENICAERGIGLWDEDEENIIYVSSKSKSK